MLTCHSRTTRLRGSGLLAPRRRMATIACSMPASVYSRVARKRKFSTLSLRSAVENGSFSKIEGLFKASTASLVSQLQSREKWRCCGNHNYQKVRLECTQVGIDRKGSMVSQRDNQPSANLKFQTKLRRHFEV